jgi:hypothetical protein
MQRKIIHGPDPQENLPWESLSNPVHKPSARPTEVIRHILMRTDGFGLPEGAEIGFTADVSHVGTENAEV